MGDMSISLQFASLYDGQVFIWSNCLLDLGTDFVAGNTVFARDACMQTLTMACMQTLMRMCKDFNLMHCLGYKPAAQHLEAIPR